jgi:hypothetical protein
MKIRHIVLAVASVAALTPVISNASPEKVSLKACANAFATSIASPGVSSPDYKLAYTGESGSNLMEYAHEYEFMLEAHNKAGVAFARARCATDANGVVTSIASVPLNQKDTKLASTY